MAPIDEQDVWREAIEAGWDTDKAMADFLRIGADSQPWVQGTLLEARINSICMLVCSYIEQDADFFSRNPAVLDRYTSIVSLLFACAGFRVRPTI
jgi:hypothetical protein